MLVDRILSPQTGAAFELKEGQYLKVLDPQGEQVSDLFCVDARDLNDNFSAGRTIDYNETILIGPGQFLYAQSGKQLMEVVVDTCGRHDLLVTPCSLQMFQMINKNQDDHPSCIGNLTQALSPFGILPSQITSTLNIFMNIQVAPSGKIKIEPPLSIAGDHIVFRASCDLIVGLTACSDESTNNGICKPIQYQIMADLLQN